jgi:hypothetical protein
MFIPEEDPMPICAAETLGSKAGQVRGKASEQPALGSGWADGCK